MDLTSLIKWAKEFDTKQAGVEEKDELRANSYLKMIVEKGDKVFFNNNKTQKFMDDIQEYLKQLEKVGVSPQKKEVLPQTTANPEAGNTAGDPVSESPLIP